MKPIYQSEFEKLKASAPEHIKKHKDPIPEEQLVVIDGWVVSYVIEDSFGHLQEVLVTSRVDGAPLDLWDLSVEILIGLAKVFGAFEYHDQVEQAIRGYCVRRWRKHVPAST